MLSTFFFTRAYAASNVFEARRNGAATSSSSTSKRFRRFPQRAATNFVLTQNAQTLQRAPFLASAIKTLFKPTPFCNVNRRFGQQSLQNAPPKRLVGVGTLDRFRRRALQRRPRPSPRFGRSLIALSDSVLRLRFPASLFDVALRLTVLVLRPLPLKDGQPLRPVSLR